MEGLIVCHSLAEIRGHTMQDDIDEIVVCHLSIDIEYSDIVQVFLHNTCLLVFTDLVKALSGL